MNPAMNYRERAIDIPGAQGPLFGVLTEPPGPSHAAMLIVAGQPQTRVGSHRMFTDLASMLAGHGVSSLRFDIGGWGDSPGEPLPFEASDRDITAAFVQLSDALLAPSKLWVLGLCDGASAAVLALPALRAVGREPAALCLVNPWVRTEASLSDAMVRTYYAKRLFQKEFWARLLTGKVSAGNLIREPLKHLKGRFGARAADSGAGAGAAESAAGAGVPGTGLTSGGGSGDLKHTPQPSDLPAQLIKELDRYQGRVLTVLSGNDLTAGETESLMARDKRWRKRLDRKGEILRVPGADHTFSEPSQWAGVAKWVAERARER